MGAADEALGGGGGGGGESRSHEEGAKLGTRRIGESIGNGKRGNQLGVGHHSPVALLRGSMEDENGGIC